LTTSAWFSWTSKQLLDLEAILLPGLLQGGLLEQLEIADNELINNKALQ
jgi:hypothetical protein